MRISRRTFLNFLNFWWSYSLLTPGAQYLSFLGGIVILEFSAPKCVLFPEKYFFALLEVCDENSSKNIQRYESYADFQA
jgi:hypothetical protein